MGILRRRAGAKRFENNIHEGLNNAVATPFYSAQPFLAPFPALKR